MSPSVPLAILIVVFLKLPLRVCAHAEAAERAINPIVGANAASSAPRFRMIDGAWSFGIGGYFITFRKWTGSCLNGVLERRRSPRKRRSFLGQLADAWIAKRRR